MSTCCFFGDAGGGIPNVHYASPGKIQECDTISIPPPPMECASGKCVPR